MHTCSRAWHSEDQDHRRGTAGAERMRRSDWNDKKYFGNHTGHDDDEWRSVTRQSGSVKEGRLDGINISLDTLDREKYQEITGTDACETVRQAVAAAAESGIRTKVNTVLQSDGDKTEWKALITLAESLPVDVRFIELMPIGYGKENTGVSNLELLDEIRKVYPDIRKDSKIHGNGPAVYYQIPGFTGGIGFISAMHGKFCKNCNRIPADFDRRPEAVSVLWGYLSIERFTAEWNRGRDKKTDKTSH